MSYPDRDNPYRRSWGNPPPDASGAIKIIAEIVENSVTTYEERKEAGQKLYDMLVKAQVDEENWKLTHPSFSKEQIENLKNLGFKIYRLNGVTLKSILDENGVIRTWNENAPFENETSMQSEIATVPYLLSEDRDKTWAEQKRVFGKFKMDIRNKIPGVDAVIGRVVDYADLELDHKSKNYGRGILDYYQPGGIRTITPYPFHENFIATVNSSYSLKSSYKLHVGLNTGEEKSYFIRILPLIIPTGIHWKGKGK